MNDCVFYNIGNNKDITFVKEYEDWFLRLNLMQFLLGTCILVHKEHIWIS